MGETSDWAVGGAMSLIGQNGLTSLEAFTSRAS